MVNKSMRLKLVHVVKNFNNYSKLEIQYKKLGMLHICSEQRTNLIISLKWLIN